MIVLPPALKLPRWDAPPEEMTPWVHAMLGGIDEIQRKILSSVLENDPDFHKGQESWKFETDDAEHGDLEPLKERLVSFARSPTERAALEQIVVRFMCLQKLPSSGKKWKDRDRKLEENDPVARAVEYARCITELWKHYYPEHERRRGLVSAVDIAADYCGVDPVKVASKLSHTPVEPPEGSSFALTRMLFRELLRMMPELARTK